MLRDINIRPALNGFIVNMGCQIIVFETVDKLVDNLRDYLRDPDKTEKAFMASGINRKHTHPDMPVPQGVTWTGHAYPTFPDGMGFNMPIPAVMPTGSECVAPVGQTICTTAGSAP